MTQKDYHHRHWKGKGYYKTVRHYDGTYLRVEKVSAKDYFKAKYGLIGKILSILVSERV